MKEVSKCEEIKFSCFDYLHFPLEDVTFEFWVLKATVWKFLLSSIYKFCLEASEQTTFAYLVIMT